MALEVVGGSVPQGSWWDVVFVGLFGFHVRSKLVLEQVSKCIVWGRYTSWT